MLVVKLELWPGGDRTAARLLEIGTIANDGTGTEVSGVYDVRLQKSPRFGGAKEPSTRAVMWKTGRVVGFNRKLSAWELVRRALNAALGGAA